MSEVIDRKTARGNRLGLLVTGLTLVLLGLFTLIRGLGLLPQHFAPAGEPLVNGPVRQAFGAAGGWLWWVIGILAVILALIALRWLFAQGRGEAVHDMTLATGPGGETRVASRGLADAITADITSHPGVLGARATLVGTCVHPGVRLRVLMEEHAPINEIRAHLGDVAIPHIREALETDHLRTVTRLKFSRKFASRHRVA
ncbi:hypothetical protein [Sinosporangium siamense]|uniref:Alkaline shock response membrane anchor protein AmaP n=1 Tax=Sinosporangium siamense TaxID=1367973 RepID=A0A919RFA0_9ACTN|nr:hypothetical protein [Sinosporangium siamense]GII92647.1 hypothetical protein Ssi02_28780 [Sinosporangium siamense]